MKRRKHLVVSCRELNRIFHRYEFKCLSGRNGCPALSWRGWGSDVEDIIKVKRYFEGSKANFLLSVETTCVTMEVTSPNDWVTNSQPSGPCQWFGSKQLLNTPPWHADTTVITDVAVPDGNVPHTVIQMRSVNFCLTSGTYWAFRFIFAFISPRFEDCHCYVKDFEFSLWSNLSV